MGPKTGVGGGRRELKSRPVSGGAFDGQGRYLYPLGLVEQALGKQDHMLESSEDDIHSRIDKKYLS